MMSGRALVPRFGGRSAPSRLGFRMPAEWEPHRATWIVWPHNWADWEVKSAAIDWCYAEIVRHLVGGERVAILVQDERVAHRARRVLGLCGIDGRRVDLHPVVTNRSWIRDSGPLFVVRRRATGRREVAVTDWQFNGWARYRAWQHDNQVPQQIADRLRVSRFVVQVAAGDRIIPVVLEGGSIDVNGHGLLLTTEECLLSPIQARNPDLSRDALERVLEAALGVRRVLWLSGGISGDDTHGHVDDVARFVSPTTVLAASESDPSDDNYETLRENRSRLRAMRDLRGRALQVVPIPMPQPLTFGGQRLPASYLNFYIGNRRVLVPTFNDPNDRVALRRIARAFPTRETVGIHAVDLVLGLGTIHCLTQQEPR